MKTIRVAERAQEDLLEIWEYAVSDDPERAEQTLHNLREKFDLLLSHPLLGRERNEILIGLRSFPVGRYIIFYCPSNDGIEVLRVRHGASDWRRIFDI